ncbi:MAG TPA: ATP-binding protein, partial [Caulifigura sp.]|nr:ATP-binding protein [Caulifigura sp.]
TPLLTLLKQARAFGVGLVLATQNPVDLDYKALSNAGTWFLGRLQTERDKARVLDGLEGASASAGHTFDRASTERILSGLGNRVFLMNNVHEDHPVVIQTRWVLNYLRGPLTREQIGRLMADRKSSMPTAAAAPVAAKGTPAGTPPILPPDVIPAYVPVGRKTPRDAKIVYRPAVLGRARLHYVDSKASIDAWQKVVRLKPISDELPADVWEDAERREPDEFETEFAPAAEAAYSGIPVELTRAKSYAGWSKSFKDALYRDAVLQLMSAPDLKEASKPGETEGDFRVRLSQAARERRDTEVERLRGQYASRLNTLAEKIRKAEQRREVEATQASSAKTGALISAGMAAIGALFSRKKLSSTNLGKAASSMRAATRASEQAGDVARADENIETLKKQQAALQAEVDAESKSIQDAYSAESIKIETREVAPRKSDIAIDQVTLCWLPYTASGGQLTPAWE